MSFLKGFRGIRNIRHNVAQILLVCILLPFTAMVLFLLSSDEPNVDFINFLMSFIGEIPLCNLAFTVLSEYISVSSDVNITEISLAMLLKAFLEALLTGVSIHFCIQFFSNKWEGLRALLTKREARNFHPLPIFPAFLGLFFSSVIVKLFDFLKNEIAAFVMEIAAIAVMVVLIKVMFKGTFTKGIFSLGKLFVFVVDGLYAVIVSCFVSGMIIVSSGMAGSFNETLRFTAILVLSVMAASILTWFVHVKESFI